MLPINVNSSERKSESLHRYHRCQFELLIYPEPSSGLVSRRPPSSSSSSSASEQQQFPISLEPVAFTAFSRWDEVNLSDIQINFLC